MKQFLEPEHYAEAPKYPKDRPPTRREVWERQYFIYKDLKPYEVIVSRARTEFVTIWVNWYLRGWRKQPDWTDGDAVVPSAIPKGPFWAGEVGKWSKAVFAAIERSRSERSSR